MCDLPDMAGGVGKGCGTASPRAVERAVEKFHPAPGKFRANRIHVRDIDGEEEA